MTSINQSNFNVEVEKKIDKINQKISKVVAICVGLASFLVLVYGAISKTEITMQILLYTITPIPTLGLIAIVYVDNIIRPIIELSIANGIGYDEAQMNRALKNPNYKEHTAIE